MDANDLTLATEGLADPRFDAIDWSAWTPVERATLLFIRRDGDLLLIHKKRGLGAGKVNAPGGRIEPGETPREAAVRETREEVGVTPTGVAWAGRLRFQFVDGHAIEGFVFTATGYTGGDPVETDEARPFWAPAKAPPYDRMWADDRHWLPLMLAGTPFDGRFLFDGDRMLGHAVDVG